MQHATPLVEPDIHIEEDQQTDEEPLYRVIIHNDEATPMDFVITVLENIFQLNTQDAMKVMLTAHYKGNAYVQTLPKSEAEKRIAKAHWSAALEGYPLRFSMEPE